MISLPANIKAEIRQLSVNQQDSLHQEPNHVGTLISDFKSLDLWEINVYYLTTKSKAIFVIAAQTT